MRLIPSRVSRRNGRVAFTLIELLVVIAIILDEHQVSIDDGHFGFNPQGDLWMNLPATWHNRGCNFSFADGHAEHFKWVDPRTMALNQINSISTANNPDLKRIQAALATK